MKNVATDVYAVTYAESNSLHGGADEGARVDGSRRPQGLWSRHRHVTGVVLEAVREVEERMNPYG